MVQVGLLIFLGQCKIVTVNDKAFSELGVTKTAPSTHTTSPPGRASAPASMFVEGDSSLSMDRPFPQDSLLGIESHRQARVDLQDQEWLGVDCACIPDKSHEVQVWPGRLTRGNGLTN